MTLEGIESGALRENFLRLNRVFGNGAFPSQHTLLQTTLAPWSATATVAVVLLDRTGNKVTLQTVGGITVAQKVTASDPVLTSKLISAYRPAAAVVLPWPMSISGVVELGLIIITVAGGVTWQRVGGANTWSNNNPAALAASAVTYLGS